MKNLSQSLYRRFVSRKTTAILIAVLVFFYFLGIIVPQRAILTPERYLAWEASWPALVKTLDALELTSVYSSSPVIVLTALFFLNLILVTLGRFRRILREVKPSDAAVTADTLSSFPVRVSLSPEEGAGLQALSRKLESKGFHVVNGEGWLRAVKNAYSPLGSLFFHVSFLFFLLGGLLIFHTRFRGETVLTEGQYFSGLRQEYRTASRLSELRKELPALQFQMDKMTPRFVKMEPISLLTNITVVDGHGRRAGAIEVNRPFVTGSTSILVTDAGVAPYFSVTASGGRELLGAFVNLNILRGDEDFVPVPDTGYIIHARFWPDSARDARGALYTRSYDLKNPRFDITIRNNGVVVGSGTILSPRDVISFDNLHLSIGEIRYFGTFVITDERGGSVLIAGFLLSITGLLLTFTWVRKDVLAVGDGDGGVLVGYKTSYVLRAGGGDLEAILGAER